VETCLKLLQTERPKEKSIKARDIFMKSHQLRKPTTKEEVSQFKKQAKKTNFCPKNRQ
jgi:hypothetical protein